MKLTLKYFLAIVFIHISTSVISQDVLDLYAKADSAVRFSRMVYGTEIDVGWIDQSSKFWYSVNTRQGTEYFIMDANEKSRKKAFDHDKFAKELGTLVGKTIKPYDLPISRIKFDLENNSMEFAYNNITYEVTLKRYSISEKGKVPRRGRGSSRWINWEGRDELGSDPVYSPDSTKLAYVKDYNIYVRSEDGSAVIQLSYDGIKSIDRKYYC